MNETKTGGPAYPSHGSMGEVAHEGMTLRDYFAAKAMQAMCSQPERMAKTLRDLKATEEQAAEYIAMGAYHLADAMLKARN